MSRPQKLKVRQLKLEQVCEDSDQKTKCYASAIRLLAIREHSRRELGQKLTRKGFSLHLVDELLDELKEQNLQSDSRYAEILLKSRLRKGYGPIYVQHYLKDKGVDSDMIESILDFNDVTWQKALIETAEKKYGTQLPDDFQQKMKQMNFLKQRGFTAEQIRNYYESCD